MPTEDAAASERRRDASWGAGPAADVAHYGPDIPTEAELHLLGDLRGKHVLELGCGNGENSVAFARQGASAIGLDHSGEHLSAARRLCEQEGVKVELKQGDLADLAFLRGDSIDVAFSSYAFDFVDDLGRVFRQVHRVLKVGAPLVFSLTHPAYGIVHQDPNGLLVVARSYFDRTPVHHDRDGTRVVEGHRTVGDLYMGLAHSSYRVELILEPEPLPSGPRSQQWSEAFRKVPRTLIIKARKEGN